MIIFELEIKEFIKKTAFWIVLNVSVGILILAFCLFISDAGQNAVASILSKNMPISEESTESFENWNGFQHN